MRPDPGAKTRLKLLDLFQLIGDFTQLDLERYYREALYLDDMDR